ncbi:MAG: hypothetical protein Q9172_005698 [Xanthocarpia lactea]
MLNKVWHIMKDGPQDTRRLFKRLKRLETIILEIKRVGEESIDETFRKGFQQCWTDNVEDMREDFSALQAKILKLEGFLTAKRFSRKHLCAQVRKLFSNEDIAKYEHILSGHMETFNMMLSLYSRDQSKTQLKLLNRLTYSTDSIETSLQQRTVDKEEDLSQLFAKTVHQSVRHKLANLSLRGCNDEQQHALKFLQNTPFRCESLRVDQASTARYDPYSTKLESLTTEIEANHHDSGSHHFDESNNLDMVQLLNGFHQPKYPRQFQRSKSKQCVLGRLLIHHLPLGILSVAVTERSTTDTSAAKSRNDWAIELSLFPQSWLANRVIKLSITASNAVGEAPSVSWSLTHTQYNSNPELVSCLQNADVDGLQRLFTQGDAKPSDCMAPRGHTLLHASIINYASGSTESLEVCQFLLEQGADPNIRSANGRYAICVEPNDLWADYTTSTPLLLCCSLMLETRNLELRLQSLASLLIQADADLTVYNNEGFAACSLVFRSQHGLSYLESFVYRYIDLYTLEEMTSADAWIVAALARSFPTFRRCMESHIASYRSPLNLSLRQRAKEVVIPQFDEGRQIAEVKRASVKLRTSFLRSLCARGTVSMIQPFLDGGCLDLDEFEGELPVTYMRAAASQGNTEIVLALLNAGASVNTEASCSEYGWQPPQYRALSAVDDLLSRWRLLRENREQLTGNPEQEYWILRKLLQNRTFCEPNALFWAIWQYSPATIIKDLLDAGCGRRDNTSAVSWCQKVNGSEVIEAVKFGPELLPLLLAYGLAKECEDCFGFTALLHALDGGQRSRICARILIDEGVDLMRKTRSGCTPLELVEKNVTAEHPRWPVAARTPGPHAGPRAIDQNRLLYHPISLEEDQKAYDLLKIAVGQKRGPSRNIWTQGTTFLSHISPTYNVIGAADPKA